jgi:putative transposase
VVSGIGPTTAGLRVIDHDALFARPEFADSIKSVPPLAVSDTGCSCPQRTRLGTPARWRAVDEHGVVLDVLLKRPRDTEKVRMFLPRLLGEFHVPETICTDKLASYGAAIRELPTLQAVDHQQVIRAARCNNLIEQRAGVVYGVRSAQDNPTVPPRQQERGQLGFRKIKRAQEFLTMSASAGRRPHGRPFCPRSNQHRAFQM